MAMSRSPSPSMSPTAVPSPRPSADDEPAPAVRSVLEEDRCIAFAGNDIQPPVTVNVGNLYVMSASDAYVVLLPRASCAGRPEGRGFSYHQTDVSLVLSLLGVTHVQVTISIDISNLHVGGK